MTRKTQRMLKKLFPYFSVLIIGFLIVLGVLLFARPEGEEKEKRNRKESSTAASEETEETSTTEETTTEETSPTVAATDVLQVDILINRYYTAKISDNADELNIIVDGDEEYNVAELANESQFIDRYENFITYTIPGNTDDCFLVYVKYDIYFNGISTGAPALNHFIVTKNQDGYYSIYDREVTDELQAYITETENSEIVVALKKQVEDELRKACDENEDLKYLMAMLNNEPVTEESSEETAPPESGPEETVTEGVEEAPSEDTESTESQGE